MQIRTVEMESILQQREAVGLLSLWAAESVQTIFIGTVIKVNVPVGCLQVNGLK